MNVLSVSLLSWLSSSSQSILASLQGMYSLPLPLSFPLCFLPAEISLSSPGLLSRHQWHFEFHYFSAANYEGPKMDFSFPVRDGRLVSDTTSFFVAFRLRAGRNSRI